MAKQEKCGTCQRGERHFDGCSHSDCPKRRMQTARVNGEHAYADCSGVLHGQAVNGGPRRIPIIKDEE
jgi:hypothetical protein